MRSAPLLAAAAILALSSCEKVTKRYATLDDARRDRLFERGWLPDILPPSARDIRVTSDLDVNSSEGEFLRGRVLIRSDAFRCLRCSVAARWRLVSVFGSSLYMDIFLRFGPRILPILDAMKRPNQTLERTATPTRVHISDD